MRAAHEDCTEVLIRPEDTPLLEAAHGVPIDGSGVFGSADFAWY